MIVEILRLVGGLTVALFIPGYLLIRIFFEELKLLEKIVLSILFSIMIDIAIAIYFGYNEAQAIRTGGLNFVNIAYAEIIILTILTIAFLLKHIFEEGYGKKFLSKLKFKMGK